MNNILKSILLLFLCATAGCSWNGYVRPNEGDFTPVNQAEKTYSIGTQNFDTSDPIYSKRLAVVKQAVSDVQEIFQMDVFANLLNGKTWLAFCSSGEKAKIKGDEVVNDLRALDLKVSIYPKKPFSAIGLTDRANNRIAIDPYRIDLNREDEVIDASLLIETIAHEFTHMVAENDVVKYRDRGHDGEDCSTDKLVSYRVGKAAQAVWIFKQVMK